MAPDRQGSHKNNDCARNNEVGRRFQGHHDFPSRALEVPFHVLLFCVDMGGEES